MVQMVLIGPLVLGNPSSGRSRFLLSSGCTFLIFLDFFQSSLISSRLAMARFTGYVVRWSPAWFAILIGPQGPPMRRRPATMRLALQSSAGGIARISPEGPLPPSKVSYIDKRAKLFRHMIPKTAGGFLPLSLRSL